MSSNLIFMIVHYFRSSFIFSLTGMIVHSSTQHSSGVTNDRMCSLYNCLLQINSFILINEWLNMSFTRSFAHIWNPNLWFFRSDYFLWMNISTYLKQKILDIFTEFPRINQAFIVFNIFRISTLKTSTKTTYRHHSSIRSLSFIKP